MGRARGGDTAPGRLRPGEMFSTLAKHDIEFVVIGGFALAPHGYVRATKDVDVMPNPDLANLHRLANALRDLDARPDLGELDPGELDIAPDEQGLSMGGNWVLATRFGRLDIMQTVPGLRDYRQLRAGAIAVDGVLYAGYDELISMKAASGRDEDLRDIGALEAAHSDH